jgi:hypothetical protein
MFTPLRHKDSQQRERAMLEPLTRLVELTAGLIALCFFVPLGVYLFYSGNPPPKIERLLDRAIAVFERGADSLFSRLRRDHRIIDVTPEKPRELNPPEKLVR